MFERGMFLRSHLGFQSLTGRLKTGEEDEMSIGILREGFNPSQVG